MAKISQIRGREILNSKGIPTVEVRVTLDNGLFSVASCPTGTSVSGYESKEVRDQDPKRYAGMGVLQAVNNINEKISEKLVGMEITNQQEIDKTMIQMDGTPDKSSLGSNSILPISMACAKAAAMSLNMPLYKYIRKFINSENINMKIPVPLFNILNGGKHAGNNLDFQEFLVIPNSSMQYKESLNMAVGIYQSLRNTLKAKGATTLIGDEGGFGPTFATNRDSFLMLNEAISNSNFRLSYDVFLGIDASADNFYEDGKYVIKDTPSGMTSAELVTLYQGLTEEFNLLYIEDPFFEDDWEGWEGINKVASGKTMVVGDDLTATNLMRLQMALSKNAIGGIIIKPNQIGTVIEAIAVVEVARQAGIKIIASHRSGDTNDDFIADFAVGVSADYVKFGAPARGERVAKYNRLLEIEREIRVA